MAFELLTLEKEGHISILSFNRPERMNAMTNDSWVELSQALDKVDQDPEVRVLIITGKGRGFCAGQDLNTLKEMQRDIKTGMQFRIVVLIFSTQEIPSLSKSSPSK